MTDIVEKATKVMHFEVCCPCDPQGCDWTHTREVRYARALAAAGLLAHPLTTRAEAWNEGFADGVNHDLGDWENAPSTINNPYAEGEK